MADLEADERYSMDYVVPHLKVMELSVNQKESMVSSLWMNP